MSAAIRGGNSVTIPTGRTVRIERPCNRPFDAALTLGKLLAPGEWLRCHTFARADLLGKVICETSGKFEHSLCGDIL